ncbi:hypothetical protein DW761_06030 [Absiella sp. AM29-15]|nr:hypothetical protein DW761_06030 [Absiella sp. AM29-15]
MSIYALAVLCIILSFVTYCVMKTQTTALLIKQSKQHIIELYCIHQAKDKLKETLTEEKETSEESKETDLDEQSLKEVERVTKNYQGTTITFSYTKESVNISYRLNHITYAMDIYVNEQHEIMDIRYT